MFFSLAALLCLTPQVLASSTPSAGSRGTDEFRAYYTCYYNQYFGVKPAGNNSRRDSFVQSLLADSTKKGEAPPSEACVKWMCDPGLVWSRREEAGLEVWAYYSRARLAVPSWGRCFTDQLAEFRENNYTVTRAGVHAVLKLAGGRKRLFFVPSADCYRAGAALVDRVVDVLVDGLGDLDTVFAEFCRAKHTVGWEKWGAMWSVTSTTVPSRNTDDNPTSRTGTNTSGLSEQGVEWVELQAVCVSLGLQDLPCSWDTALLLLYILLLLAALNGLLLACAFRRRIAARLRVAAQYWLGAPPAGPGVVGPAPESSHQVEERADKVCSVPFGGSHCLE
jgi:hypothetical protein